MAVEKISSSNPSTAQAREDVSGRTFPIARRGFDPTSVSSYLAQLAGELERADAKIQELVAQRDAAEERARNPSLDEALLATSLGQHSAAVLRGAHEEAGRLLSQAEDAAAATVRDAQRNANETKVGAESAAAERIARAELEANAIVQRAREGAAEALEAARAEGEATVERAREHGRGVLEEVNAARQRALDDLAARKRLVTEQIERLRAARDEIAGSVLGVRRSLDQIVADLSRTDEAARAALGAHVADPGAAGGAHEGASPGPKPEPEPRVAPLRVDDVATMLPPLEEAPDAGTASEPEEAPAGPGTGDAAGNVTGAPEEAPAAPEDAPVVEASAAPEQAPSASAEEAKDPDGVDGLFARLRAGEAGGDGGASGARGDEGAGEVGGDGDNAPSGAEERQSERSLPTADAVVGAEDGAQDGADDAADFARRAGVLDPIVTAWARRMKRALRDDQNRLLDRLRQETGEWTGDLLPDEEAQRALYVDASTAAVRECIAAGTTFGRGAVGARQSKAQAVDERAVEEVARALGEAVVSQLRRKLESAETLDAAERVGAAYREWRGERIEQLSEDAAIEAFSRGVVSGAGRRSALRWVRNLKGSGCADCEDNALAGSVPAGERFPTGHLHPPLHAGCRCLVLPVGPAGATGSARRPGTARVHPT